MKSKRLELSLNPKIYDKIEKYREKNNYIDKQDVIYDMIMKKFGERETFFSKIIKFIKKI